MNFEIFDPKKRYFIDDNEMIRHFLNATADDNDIQYDILPLRRHR